MNPKKSRLLRSSRTKSIGKELSRMNKTLAYVGVLVLVVGLLLTTCVGSAWSMEVLTDEQMAEVHGRSCAEWDCVSEMCGTSKPCSLIADPPTDNCAYEQSGSHYDCSEKVRLPYKQCQTTGSDPECSNLDKNYNCIQWKCAYWYLYHCAQCNNESVDRAYGCDS